MQNGEQSRIWNGDHTQTYRPHAESVQLPPIQAFHTQIAPSLGEGAGPTYLLPGFTNQCSAMMQGPGGHSGVPNPTYEANGRLVNPPHYVVSSFNHQHRPGGFHLPNPNPAATVISSHGKSPHPVHSTSSIPGSAHIPSSAANQASVQHPIHRNQEVDVRLDDVGVGAGTEMENWWQDDGYNLNPFPEAEGGSPVSSMNAGATISRPSSGVSALSGHDLDQDKTTQGRPELWSPSPELEDFGSVKFKDIMEAKKRRVEREQAEEHRDGSEPGRAKTGGNASSDFGGTGGGSKDVEVIQPGRKATRGSAANRGRGSNRGGSRRGGKAGKGNKAAPADEQVAQLEPELLKTLDTPAQKVKSRTWTVEEMDALAMYITSEKIWENFKVNQSHHFMKICTEVEELAGRDFNQCQNKWANLYAKYKAVRLLQKQTGGVDPDSAEIRVRVEGTGGAADEGNNVADATPMDNVNKDAKFSSFSVKVLQAFEKTTTYKIIHTAAHDNPDVERAIEFNDKTSALTNEAKIAEKKKRKRENASDDPVADDPVVSRLLANGEKRFAGELEFRERQLAVDEARNKKVEERHRKEVQLGEEKLNGDREWRLMQVKMREDDRKIEYEQHQQNHALRVKRANEVSAAEREQQIQARWATADMLAQSKSKTSQKAGRRMMQRLEAEEKAVRLRDGLQDLEDGSEGEEEEEEDDDDDHNEEDEELPGAEEEGEE